MFEEDWTPRDTIIDYDDGTINGMPLADSREHEQFRDFAENYGPSSNKGVE
jgi:hypothetical protein